MFCNTFSVETCPLETVSTEPSWASAVAAWLCAAPRGVGCGAPSSRIPAGGIAAAARGCSMGNGVCGSGGAAILASLPPVCGGVWGCAAAAARSWSCGSWGAVLLALRPVTHGRGVLSIGSKSELEVSAETESLVDIVYLYLFSLLVNSFLLILGFLDS